MESYEVLKRLKNKFWKIKSDSVPSMSHFRATANTELRNQSEGKATDLFFTNENETVHKWLHFLPIYDRVLASRAGSDVRFLEIGVFKGGSMRFWRDFLGADATIFGIDINPECAAFDGRSGQVRIGSQADPDFLQEVVAEMGGVDVVLDDGSHIASHQRASFETLFPLLSEGGLYLIEDMHTAYWPNYEGGLGRKGTAVEFLKEKIDAMHMHYVKKGRNTASSIAPIESIQFFDSIAVVEKRSQKPRHHVMVPEPDPA